MSHLSQNINLILHPARQPAPVDWKEFVRQYIHHRMFGNLEALLQEHGEAMPERTRQGLKDHYRNQLGRQLLLAKELEKICKLLNREGLFYINMKGTMLGMELYGNLTERLTRDIDFLVRDHDVDLFLMHARSLGYELSAAERKKAGANFRAAKKNYTLFHGESGIILELHWGLFSNPFFYPAEYRFLQKPVIASLNGTSVNVMNREHNFLYLCMHGVYHEFFRLFWLRDIAVMLENPDLPVEGIKKEAEKDGSIRIVALAALMAKRVFGISSVFDEYETKAIMKDLVEHNIRVINRSSQPGLVARLKRVVYFMKLRKEWRYKLDCILGVVRRYRIRM